MKWWTVARVAGPGSIGLALVILRPSWVSVVTLGLLLVVAMWFDGQERRADDVEDLREWVADEFRRHAEANGKVLSDLNESARELREKMSETTKRLDIMAQQRKGPIL